jgi:hypothetical protein
LLRRASAIAGNGQPVNADVCPPLFSQDLFARLDRHIRASADGGTQIRLRECRRIVHTITDHGRELALSFGAAEYIGLVFGGTSAKTRSIPTCFATTSPVRRLSPVIITG